MVGTLRITVSGNASWKGCIFARILNTIQAVTTNFFLMSLVSTMRALTLSIVGLFHAL